MFLFLPVNFWNHWIVACGISGYCNCYSIWIVACGLWIVGLDIAIVIGKFLWSWGSVDIVCGTVVFCFCGVLWDILVYVIFLYCKWLEE